MHWYVIAASGITIADHPQNDALERYGAIATIVPPRLLEMALEIFVCQAGTQHLVNVPDWTRNWSYDSRYRRHPLYTRTLHYREVSTIDPAPAAASTPVIAAAAIPATVAPATAATSIPAIDIAAPPVAVRTTVPAADATSTVVQGSSTSPPPIPLPSPAPLQVKPIPASRKAKQEQAAVTFDDAAGPSVIHTPPRAGPSRKRTSPGSSSNKESGQATPKRRKFKVSPKGKISTRTGRLMRTSKVQPAKSKRAGKSKEILTDTDDEGLAKQRTVPAAKAKGKERRYMEIDDDDAVEEAAKRKLPAIVVGRKLKKVSPSPHWIRSLPYLHPPLPYLLPLTIYPDF